MKKQLLAAVAGATLLGTVAFASPASAKQTLPGTPFTSNCVGQTTAYIAQGGFIPGGISARGIGNVAKANGVTTAQVHDAIEFYCATGIVI